MLFKLLAGWIISMAVFFFLVPVPAFSAEFSADLVIRAPDSNYTFKLYVKDTMYRLEKVKGGMKFPPFPTIVSRSTGLTWGLNPQARQYVEMKDVRQTMMMNPIPGWEMMRKDYKKKAAGSKTVNGYVCDKFVYHKPGKSKTEAAVWISKKLDHFIKQIHYATNGNAVMELKNISEDPVNNALFKIPAGYSKMSAGGPGASAGAASAPQPAKQAKVSASDGASAGNVMFILDASGSMWGQVEGKAKIAIAKEVLVGLIKDLPDDLHVGLVAYGHRRKGDCNDVEELVTLSVLDKKKLIKKIQAISPKGKTPITLSVRKTAQKLKTLKDETTIILVSDGKETCAGDPCALVKELKQAGVKFVMHVIGFDVTEEEREQLECMAKAGGGKYFTADNASQFSAAASEVVKKPTPTYGTLRVTVTKNGKPFFTAVTLTNLETSKSWAPASSSEKTGIAEVRLEPGNYTAELKDLSVSGGKTPAVKLTDIVIVAGETVERSADFSDGTLVITTFLNGTPFKGHIYYYRQGENKHFHNENAHPKTGQLKRQLLPGVYRIKVETDSIAGKPAVVIAALEIQPGSTVEKTAEFFSGEVTVASTLNGKPYGMPFKIYNPAGKEIYKAWTAGGQRLVRLPAGTYAIKVTTNVDGSIKSFENVIVETGQPQTVKADFSFGKLTIAATLNGQPFSTPFKIYDSAGKQVRKNWTQNGQRTEMLAEGVYSIKIINIKNKKQVVTFENVQVKTGETTERTGSFGE